MFVLDVQILLGMTMDCKDTFKQPLGANKGGEPERRRVGGWIRVCGVIFLVTGWLVLNVRYFGISGIFSGIAKVNGDNRVCGQSWEWKEVC